MKDGVTAPDTSQFVTKEDLQSLLKSAIETSMEEAFQKVMAAIEDKISAAVNRMAITISQQLSTDMQSALRRVDDEMTEDC